MSGRLAARLALLVGVAAACGCGSHEEAVERFAAERARWKIDRLERHNAETPDSVVFYAHVRREHERIAQRFGPTGAIPSGARLDPDASVRYRIAGSSALYALDLAVRGDVTTEMCAHYGEIAGRYAFDPEVAVRARTHEGLARQRMGDVHGAMTAFAQALDASFPPEATVTEVPPFELLRADVEVHAAWLGEKSLSAGEAAAAAQRGVERLSAKVTEWNGKRGDRWLDRRRGELLAVSGRGDDAVQVLEKLAGTAAAGEDRADIALVLAEVEQVALGRAEVAEKWYRSAVSEGAGRPIGSAARLALGNMLRTSGRAREASDILAPAIIPGAATTPEDRAEALYSTARCFEALDRPEDALLTATRGATEEGPFALACAARHARRTRELNSPDAARETSALVGRAARDFDAWRRALALRDYTSQLRIAREGDAWHDVLTELSSIAVVRAGTSLADSARTVVATATSAGLAGP